MTIKKINIVKNDKIGENMARKPIDKNIRSNVWRRYWGSNMEGYCWVCGRSIQVEMFECGHIISAANKGGDDVLNLVPICGSCNKGMGKENLLDYKKRAFSHINVSSLVQPESSTIYKEKDVISRSTIMTAVPIDNDIEEQRQGTMIAQPVDEDLPEKDKRERYGEYVSAVQKILPDIKKMISSNKGKEIKFGAMDIAKDLGEDFIDKSPTTIYWGLKYVLFKERIVVDMSTRSGEKFLIMRNATPDDKLPPSLAKYLEQDNVSKEISEGIKKKMSSGELRDMLKDLPTSLGNTLEVYYYILDGLTRIDATNFVAKRKDVTPSTISSSYTRSLEKSTSEIDILIQPENNKKFKNILIDKFPEHVDKINEFFSNM